MAKKKIPLYDLKLSQKAHRQVASTLKSGWLTTGPKVTEFEQAIGKYLGVKYTAAVNSGTAGLLLTLKVIGMFKGREIITTPFSFVATAEAILQAGAMPVFADINPHTLNIDPDEILRKINTETACVLSVDIAGYPADYDKLVKICDYHKVPLISDSSHAFGTLYRRKSIPKLTDVSVYSFHATKNLTCGEGGMVVSKHKELIRVLKILARHGMTSGAFQRKKLKKPWEYDVVNLGAKANMSDIHAAVGLGQLSVFENYQKKRKALAERYFKNLTDMKEFVELPPVEKKIQPAWHLFIIKLQLDRLSVNRDEVIAQMADKGIECGLHYKPIFEFSFYRQQGINPAHFPNTVYTGRRVMTLPLHPELKLSDIDYVCDNLVRILKKNRR